MRARQLLKEKLLGKNNKNLSVLFLSLFILMAIFTTASSADVNKWTSQNSGNYNPLDVITFGTNLTDNIYAGTGSYLGTGGFVYRSIDGGIKWDYKVNESPFSSYVYSIQVDSTDSNIIYAGTYNGVYKTIDGGTTWTLSNGSPVRTMTDDYVFALAVDPFNHNRIYAGTRGGVNSPNSGKVFLSEDGGTSWIERSNGLNNVYVLSLLTDLNYPNTIYAGTTGGSEPEKSGGVYKTINGGLSWVELNNGLSSTWINALAIDPLNTSIIYAATSDGVFKSINSGASWTQYKTGMTFQHISSIIVDPSMGENKIVYAGGGFKPYNASTSLNTSGAVFRSINGGEEWIPINTGFRQASTGDISTRIYSLIFKPGDYNTIYAGTNDGIYGYTINANAPKIPTGFRLTEEGDRKVVLGWNANTETDLAGYRIYRWDPVSNLYVKQGDDIPNSKVTFTDDAVANNVTYFYKLSAFNTAGFESPQTDYIYATPHVYVEPPTVSQAIVQLYKNWNLIALPINLTTPFTAQSLLDLINSQGGDATQIVKWNPETQSWVTHTNNVQVNNFEVKPGEGYFIKSNIESQFTLAGTPVSPLVSINFYKDWNLVGIPYLVGKYTAQTLLDEINKQGGDAVLIVKWNPEIQSWLTHINNIPINNFEIKPDEGYFVKTGKASEFVP